MATIGPWQNSGSPLHAHELLYNGIADNPNAIQTLNFAYASASYEVSGDSVADAMSQTSFTTSYETAPHADTFYAAGHDSASAGFAGHNGIAGLSSGSGYVSIRYAIFIVDFYLQSQPEALNRVRATDASLTGYQYVDANHEITPGLTWTEDPRSASFQPGTRTGFTSTNFQAEWVAAATPNTFEKSITFLVAVLPMSAIGIRGYATTSARFAEAYSGSTRWDYTRRIALPTLSAPLSVSTINTAPVIGGFTSWDWVKTAGSSVWTPRGILDPDIDFTHYMGNDAFDGLISQNSDSGAAGFIDSLATDGRAALIVYPLAATYGDALITGSGGVTYGMESLAASPAYSPTMQWRGIYPDPALDQSLRSRRVHFSPV